MTGAGRALRGAVPVVLVLAAACRGGDELPAPAVAVASGPVEIAIEAHGVLAAVSSTKIVVPNDVDAWYTVERILPDGSPVKAGDEIVRFSAVEIDEEEQKTRSELTVWDIKIDAKRDEIDRTRQSIDEEIDLVGQEKRFAERFKLTDAALYSRLEILESATSVEYLEARARFLDWRRETLDLRAATELDFLGLQRRTRQLKLEQLDQTRKNLSVRAPHDGVLYYEWYRSGELQPGAKVRSGWELASLPDPSAFQADVVVLESEAAGLATGLEARVMLVGARDRIYHGRVTHVDSLAKKADDDSPIKVFGATIVLDETDRERMRPGAAVEATIVVARLDDAITVPNQALFSEQGETWVWIERGGQPERRTVTIGPRSLTRTVVERGLGAGEVVRLTPPAES